MCYLYFFCLHCCLINIHIFDYPDSRLSGLFTEVPTSPDNRGSTVWLFSLGNYTFAPHSLFQKLRLFSFSTLSYLSLIKFQISLVLREVMDLEAKCVIMLLLLDFVWESTSSKDNSQKLGKNLSVSSRIQTCHLPITCSNSLWLRCRKFSINIKCC